MSRANLFTNVFRKLAGRKHKKVEAAKRYGVKNSPIFSPVALFQPLQVPFVSKAKTWLGRVKEQAGLSGGKDVPKAVSSKIVDTLARHQEKNSRLKVVKVNPTLKHSEKPMKYPEMMFTATMKPGYLNEFRVSAHRIPANERVRDINHYSLQFVAGKYGIKVKGDGTSQRFYRKGKRISEFEGAKLMAE